MYCMITVHLQHYYRKFASLQHICIRIEAHVLGRGEAPYAIWNCQDERLPGMLKDYFDNHPERTPNAAESLYLEMQLADELTTYANNRSWMS